MGWGAIAGAIGSAAKTTLLTAPETPDAQKELFLQQEASKREREDLEAKAEDDRNRLIQQADDDRSDAAIKMQNIFDGGLQGMGYKPVIPTGVQQLDQHMETQNQQATAISNSQNQSQASGGGFMQTGIHSQEQIDTMSGRFQASAQKDRDAWLAGGGIQNKNKGPIWD